MSDHPPVSPLATPSGAPISANGAVSVRQTGETPTPTSTGSPSTDSLSTLQLLIFAIATGFSVAALYYSQPILPLLAAEFAQSSASTGWLPTLTQLGYALGIFLLVPLGDKFDRRLLIAIKGLFLALLLALTASSTQFSQLLWLSLMIGIAATVAQDIVPATAALASEHNRGQTVGFVMTGLLLGILLSRTVSGVISSHFSWQLLYQLAAISVAISTVWVCGLLPKSTPAQPLAYPALMRSLLTLWQAYPALRRAAVVQGLLHLGFAAFWTTLAPALAATYGLGSDIAGAFGLAGAAGALLAPVAGRLADRHGAALIASRAALLSVASFALLILLPLLSFPLAMALLILTVIGFDLGVQSALIAHQSLVYSLEPAARGRLNAMLISSMFIGMASGSALGSWFFSSLGWPAVFALAAVSSFSAWWLRRP